MTISTLFLIVSLVLAILAACGWPASRVGLFPLSFAFFLLALLLGGARIVGLD